MLLLQEYILEKYEDLTGLYDFELWEPSITCFSPKGDRNKVINLFWYLLHYLRLFRNKQYGILMIKKESIIVHKSYIFPGFFRFPFMGSDDIQIGNTWTALDHRGKGLALIAIKKIIQLKKKNTELNKLWYITENSNIASLKVVNKAGIKLVGNGQKFSKFGFKFMGYYNFTNCSL